MKNNITFSLSLLALSCLQANAAPTQTSPPAAVIAEGTDFHSLIVGETLDAGDAMEPIQFGQMVLCFTNLGGASLLPSQKTAYKAVADFNLCADSDNGRPQKAGFTILPTPASAGVPQSTRMWVSMDNGAQKYQMKTEITAGVSSVNHMGVWQIDWERQNASGANTLDNGHIKSATVGGFNQYTFANYSAEPGAAEKTTLAKFSRTSSNAGFGRVQLTRSGTADPSNNGVENYTIAYNDTFVHIKEDDNGSLAESCSNHSSTVEQIFDWNLYDDTGTLVDLQSQIDFTTSGGFAGSLGSFTTYDANNDIVTGFWSWIENDNYPSTSSTITVDDSRIAGLQYDLTFTVASGGVTLDAVKDTSTGNNHVFDKPILFDTSNTTSQLSVVVQPMTDRNDSSVNLSKAHFTGDSMVYVGPGRLYGGPNGNQVNFADGTQLISANTADNATIHRGKTYFLKASFIENAPVRQTNLTNCLSLAAAMVNAASVTLPTNQDIVDNAPAETTKPIVAGAPLITDGALTPD